MDEKLRRLVEGGVFERIFKEISGAADFEYAMIGGTIVRDHQKASGAKGGIRNQAIGLSRGGLTATIVALVDALENLSDFVLFRGQAHDMKSVEPPIDSVAFDALLADKAIRRRLASRGIRRTRCQRGYPTRARIYRMRT